MSTAVVLAGAGCAGDGDDAAPTKCVPAADVAADIGDTGGGPAIAIAAVDDRFEPGCVDLTDPSLVSLVVRNDGRHPHNLTVGDDRVSVDAGQVAILEVDVPTGGLRYVCTIHPGMEGDVRVSR